jgi:DNA repair exonuclease SbcCD ATPase subunit
MGGAIQFKESDRGLRPLLDTIPRAEVGLAQRVWEIIKSFLDFFICYGNTGWSLLCADRLAERVVIPVGKSSSQEMLPVPSSTTQGTGSPPSQEELEVIAKEQKEIRFIKSFEDRREIIDLEKRLNVLDSKRNEVLKEQKMLEQEIVESEGILLARRQQEQEVLGKKNAQLNEINDIDAAIYRITVEKSAAHLSLAEFKKIEDEAFKNLHDKKLATKNLREEKERLESLLKKEPQPVGKPSLISEFLVVRIDILLSPQEFQNKQNEYKARAKAIEEKGEAIEKQTQAEEEALSTYIEASSKYAKENERIATLCKEADEEIARKRSELEQEQAKLKAQTEEIATMKQTLQHAVDRVYLLKQDLERASTSYRELNAQYVALELQINDRKKEKIE